MTIENPFFADKPFADPQTIDEIAQNDIVDIHNAAEAGAISNIQAKDQMDTVEQTRISVGEGWFDRYGPPPPELDFLYEGTDRYWEVPVEDRTKQ
jgi:hypothetical protein